MRTIHFSSSIAVVAVALGLGLATPTDAAITTNLEAYWNFDDSVEDQTAANRDGTLNGNAGYSAATPLGGGKSLELDGAGDYVVINGGASGNSWTGVLGTSARTNAAWIKSTSANPTDDMAVISWGKNLDGQRWGMWVDENVATHPLRLVLFGGTVQGGPDLADQSWHHVAIGVPSSAIANDASLWVDGVLRSHDNSNTRTVNTVANYLVKIGVAVSVGESDFNGQIDDTAVWSALKTNQEMAVIHGLGRYSGVALDDPSIDAVLAAFNAQSTATAGGDLWAYRTAGELGNPSPTIGVSGGTSGVDAFIVLDASGNGMQTIPEPTTLALAALGLLGLRRRKR